jgi:hypothetical protein
MSEFRQKFAFMLILSILGEVTHMREPDMVFGLIHLAGSVAICYVFARWIL